MNRKKIEKSGYLLFSNLCVTFLFDAALLILELVALVALVALVGLVITLGKISNTALVDNVLHRNIAGPQKLVFVVPSDCQIPNYGRNVGAAPHRPHSRFARAVPPSHALAPINLWIPFDPEVVLLASPVS